MKERPRISVWGSWLGGTLVSRNGECQRGSRLGGKYLPCGLWSLRDLALQLLCGEKAFGLGKCWWPLLW